MPHKNNLYPHTYTKQVNKELVFLKNFIRNPNISVGDYSYYHDDRQYPERFEEQNTRGFGQCKLTIGKFCAIARGTTFIADDMNHPMDGFSTYPFFCFEEWDSYTPPSGKGRNIVVGNDVWFGTNAVIMPGVEIGDGAIIGASALVTKDVAPYSIVGGNPSRIIRKRFSEEIISELLRIRWWDWEYEKITRNIQYIVGSNIEHLKKCQ